MGTFTWVARFYSEKTKTITSSDSVGFFGSTLRNGGYPLELGEWNSRTYYSSVSGSAQYVMLNTTSGGINLPIIDTLAPLQITFADTSAVTVLAVTLRAFALGEVNPPQGLAVLAAEASGSSVGVPVNGSSVWSRLSGSLGSYHLDMAPRPTAATSHVFRVAVTVSPTEVGKHIGNVLQLTTEYN
jgi:hypothetical protein